MTTETRIRESQVRPPDQFDDNLPAGQQLQDGAEHLEDVVRAIISQLRRVTGKQRWYDGLGDVRSLTAIHADLLALESKAFEHRVVAEAVQIGDIVSVVGNDAAERADVTRLNESAGVGVVFTKPTPTSAIIQLTGKLEGVYAGLIPGKTYFIGENGRPRLGSPQPGPGQRMFVQAIGSALAEDCLLLSNNFNISAIRG